MVQQKFMPVTPLFLVFLLSFTVTISGYQYSDRKVFCFYNHCQQNSCDFDYDYAVTSCKDCLDGYHLSHTGLNYKNQCYPNLPGCKQHSTDFGNQCLECKTDYQQIKDVYQKIRCKQRETPKPINISVDQDKYVCTLLTEKTTESIKIMAISTTNVQWYWILLAFMGGAAIMSGIFAIYCFSRKGKDLSESGIQIVKATESQYVKVI